MVIFHEPIDLNEIIKRTRMIVWLTFFICTIAWVPDGASALGAPPDSPSGQESTRSLIRQAAQAADQAWEEFHRAAIGGTLASPEIQAQIEEQLHEVRRLLMEARKAERANQSDSVKTMTQKIFDMTNFIVQASRERKS